jgi:hypothetical protein
MTTSILTFLVIVAATTIEPLNLVLGLIIGAILGALAKPTELRWVLVVAAAFALNAALRLPFGGHISPPALIANFLQVAFGAWLFRRWKTRTAK